MPFDFHADAYAGRDVAKALGFDPHGMVEINLKFRAGDLLVVTTEQLVPAEKLPKVIGEIVKRKYIVNCVAEPTEERHDESTCCGERQATDVGEGWRWLRDDDVLRDGDEVLIHGEWSTTFCAGKPVGMFEGRYRRRVTPAPPAEADTAAQWRALRKGEEIRDGDEAYYALIGWKPSHLKVGTVVGDGTMQFRRRVTPVAPELSPAAVSAMCQRNERAALLAKIATLRSEAEQQQEIILHAGLEIERLKAEVERLRMSEEERAAIKRMIGEPDSHPSWAESRCAKLLRDLLKRLGGGE